MKFKVSRKYIALQCIQAILGYSLGLLIVLYFLSIEDTWGFIIASFCGCLLVYCLFMCPSSINIENGHISFRKLRGYNKKISLDSIADIEEKKGRMYDYVKIKTKSGKSYKLYPSDCSGLCKAIQAILFKR